MDNRLYIPPIGEPASSCHCTKARALAPSAKGIDPSLYYQYLNKSSATAELARDADDVDFSVDDV